ncbi:MAG: hypothetical protein AAFP86_12675, partial [Planctomycetota bacterium]
VDLDDPRVVERILRYDDLDPAELAALERDPRARQLLDQLRSVDRFLHAGAPDAAPAPEELYAYGKGPGAAPSEGAHDADTRRWLAAHPEEAAWTESLEEQPPSPVFAEALAPGAPDPEVHQHRTENAASAGHERPRAIPFTPRPRRRTPAWLAWTPLAAAALLVAMALGGDGERGVMAGGLPDSPLLRSASEAPLLFPRGRVVAGDGALFAAAPVFEIAPQLRATDYRIEVRQLPIGASAFEPGRVVWTETSSAAVLIGPALEPGRYEWSARATVDGIDVDLGARSFSVVAAGSAATAAADGEVSDPTAVRADVRALHAAGFVTDARHRARALPPGEERDDYLAPPR